jgi:hypothetical protein
MLPTTAAVNVTKERDNLKPRNTVILLEHVYKQYFRVPILLPSNKEHCDQYCTAVASVPLNGAV